MSYKITRNGKDYEFENQAKYEEFYNQAKEKARDNNLSTAQAFNVLYTPYVAPTNTETPSTPTTNYSSLIDNAVTYKNSAYANAEGVKNASYAQALKAREEAEALAEIQRKRGVVDASTMAAQERATYGANAEALGRMGLNVSGYSDYLNSQAYAKGMAYRQQANAQATDMKRQATYQEALARLDADKAYSQATAEADKTYYGMLNEIESAKIADAQAQEQQKQTNYQNFMNFAIENGLTAEQISTLAPSYGIGTKEATKVAETSKALYGDAERLTDKQLTDLETTRDAQMLSKDYVGAAKTNTQMSHPDASAEQKQLFESEEIVGLMDAISSDPSSWSSIANNLANYGDNGAKNIKEAFSNSEYVASADNLSKNELKAVINSGLLTDEAKSRLEAMYTIRFDNTKQINIYEFSKYAGSDKESSNQSKYIDAIKTAVDKEKKANDGKNQYDDEYEGLKVGDIVDMNYGIDAKKILSQMSGGVLFPSILESALYEYKGNGVFEPVKGGQWASVDKDKLFIPEGYRRNIVGQVKEKK